MKDCILITGGAGFIGSALSHLLRAEDARPIVAIDNLHPQVHPSRARPVDLHPDVELIVADICEPETWNAFMAEWRPSLVVHLAAETGTVIAANMWGKVKTVLQMLTIIFYYFVGALAGPTDVGFVSFVTMVLCWLCGAATLLSGGIYLWQNRRLFMQAK